MNRRLGLIITAVVLAIAGSTVVFLYVHNADNRAIKGMKAVKVLIVQKQIPTGTSWRDVVNNGFVEQDTIPESSAPSSALNSVDAPIQATDVAGFDIASGQVLTRQMFGAKAPAVGPLPIPDKLQAVTISLPPEADVGRYVQAGSQVEVYQTFKVKLGGTNNNTTAGDDVMESRVLLARVTVLAVSEVPAKQINGSTDNATSGGGNILVTLAVGQGDATRIALAVKTGTLSLGLLSASSDTPPESGVFNFLSSFNPQPIF